jgi:hypothetical protein
LTKGPALAHIWRMANAPVKPRNMLYTSIAFAVLGGLMVYNGSEFKYTLIGWVPSAVFLAVFVWALLTEKRF